jgi:hypothetical protein
MEDRILNHFSPFQVLDHNALQKRRRDVGIPYSIRVNDDNRTSSAHAKAGCFSALDPVGPEEEPLALKQRSQVRVELPSTPVRRAKAPCADDDVTRVRLHDRIAIVC